MTKIYVFPGQGSQKKGMGMGLFEEFGELTQQADRLLGYSLRELCLEDPREELNLTQFTQPALYAVNALTFLKKGKECAPPQFLAGHSLGEYNALHAAGVFDFITGLRLVQKRGELMGRAKDGGMTAVLGLEQDKIAEAIARHQPLAVDVANFNSPEQTVIAGSLKDLERIEPKLSEAGAKRVIRLKVSAAFHSRFMDDARNEFANYLDAVELNPPHTPVIANVNAAPYSEETLKSNLANQINHSVRWVESIQYLLKQPEPDFEEIGPGKVLTRLISQIQSHSR